jgi:hypothetical protein
MRPDEAKPLQAAAQRAADWCREKLEARVAGSGMARQYSEAERTALHVAHSIAVCEVARLQMSIDEE